MQNQAAAVIIGGGCIGLSIAHSMARLGTRDIILIEREPILGSGSSGLGAGGIRQQFTTGINIRLSIESVKLFKHFREEVGEPIDFHQVGYLFLASTDRLWRQFQKSAELQHSLGVEVELLSPQEIGDRHPYLETSDLKGATFCATDGVADPHAVIQGYARAARARGVVIAENTAALDIEITDGRVTGVVTSQGRISTPTVVIAAGAWSATLGDMVGLTLPVSPLRRVCFITDELPSLPEAMPFVVDSHSGFWMRKESGGLLMGLPRPDEPAGFNLALDWDLLAAVSEAGIKRVPLLARARVLRGWAGLYEMTPDHHPIMGPVPKCAGLYVATGFSGHGFMHAPAVGTHMAELIISGTSSLDISMLSVERFYTGNLVMEDLLV